MSDADLSGTVLAPATFPQGEGSARHSSLPLPTPWGLRAMQRDREGAGDWAAGRSGPGWPSAVLRCAAETCSLSISFLTCTWL